MLAASWSVVVHGLSPPVRCPPTDSYISIYAPNWANKAAFDAAAKIAVADVANWKTGQPCTQVVQAVNAASSLLATLPVLDQQQTALMAAIVVSFDTVVSFFPQCQPPASTTLQAKVPDHVRLAASKLTPPKSGSDVKKLWKAAGGPPLK